MDLDQRTGEDPQGRPVAAAAPLQDVAAGGAASAAAASDPAGGRPASAGAEPGVSAGSADVEMEAASAPPVPGPSEREGQTRFEVGWPARHGFGADSPDSAPAPESQPAKITKEALEKLREQHPERPVL